MVTSFWWTTTTFAFILQNAGSQSESTLDFEQRPSVLQIDLTSLDHVPELRWKVVFAISPVCLPKKRLALLPLLQCVGQSRFAPIRILVYAHQATDDGMGVVVDDFGVALISLLFA